MNAYLDFKNFLEQNNLDLSDVRCAHLLLVDNGNPYEFLLTDNNYDEKINDFIQFLNKDYNNSRVELMGKVWFWDDSWAERHQYLNIFRWEYKKFDIPDYLLYK